MLNFSPSGFLEVIVIWPFFAVGLGLIYALTFKSSERDD